MSSVRGVCVVQVCVQGDWERTGHQSNWMGPVSSVCVCVCGAGMCAGRLREDRAPVKLDGTSE